MQALIDFIPLAAFGIAYWLRDVYVATAVLMIAMPVMLLLSRILVGKVTRMQLLSTALVLGFGTLTLVLRDPRFIQWKPTIYLWGVAVVFLASAFIGREPLSRKALAAVAEGREVAPAQWRRLNWLWVAFHLVLGAINLAVARSAPEAVWVNFKIFGLTAALFVFFLAQVVWLQRQPAVPDAPAG
jgi:intracellular septation protein